MFSAHVNSAVRQVARELDSGFEPLRFVTALLRKLPPNIAHQTAVKALRYGLIPGAPDTDDDILKINLWGMRFANPIGMAAGFDKNAEAVKGLFRLGFGFAEVGTVTPNPHLGNARPNLFRLEDDQAIINRLGFPSQGVEKFVRNLEQQKVRSAGIIGANLGINTLTKDPVADIVLLASKLAGLADYLVVNVSCPNTPGLAQWHKPDPLKEILRAVRSALDHESYNKKPLLVKIAPDLSENNLAAVATIALDAEVDGLIAANTTVARPSSLRSENAKQYGGLSGPVLFGPATRTLSSLYELTDGKVPIIGCGGVSCGSDAYAKIMAGASLVQFYTALIYGGPGLVKQIKRDVAGLLRADGFRSMAEAVGAHHR